MSCNRVQQFSQSQNAERVSDSGFCLSIMGFKIQLHKPDKCELLLLALLFVLLLASLAPVFAYEANTLPLQANVLSHRFKQKLLSDQVKSGTKISCANAEVSITDELLSVSGKDQAGKPWSLMSSAQTGVGSVWSADLDKNGSEDLIIVTYTGACGYAANCQLLFLMFEKDGRPFPWSVEGHFEVDKAGVKDIVDLNKNGHADLIEHRRSGTYWITSMYEARDSHWHRQPQVAGIKFPLYRASTLMNDRKPIKENCTARVSNCDYSNECGNCVEQLRSVNWDETQLSNEPQIAHASSAN